MPRSVRSVKRNKPKFRANLINRKNAATRAEKKKKQCKSSERIIKEAWDTKKTARENLQSIGLAFNPNDVVPFVQPQREVIDAVPVEGSIPFDGYVQREDYAKRYKKKENPKAKDVVSTLEKNAAEEEQRIKSQERTPNLPDRDVELCIYLIARYDDDFKAMSRDPKNLWQYTPKQIEKKIKHYKNSAFYKVIEDC